MFILRYLKSKSVKKISLTVSKPCSENWNNFTSTTHGGYCLSCNKEVIDFTKMPDDEILNYFASKPANACGRFRPHQLKSYASTRTTNIHPGIGLVRAGLVSLILLLLNKPASAQTPNQKQNVEIIDQTSAVSKSLAKEELITIRGVVVSEEDDSPLPGVNIVLKGTAVGTVTDSEGRFEFPQKLKLDDVLIFSFIGLQTKEYTVQKLEKEKSEVKLIMMLMDIMGEVAVDEPYIEPTAFHKFWTKVKRVF
jgi:hypothetical protein